MDDFLIHLNLRACNLTSPPQHILPIIWRNIHRKGKSGCEISINHYTNVCPNSSFLIQILEKLPGDGYKNGARDKAIYQYRLEREDYWIKKNWEPFIRMVWMIKQNLLPMTFLLVKNFHLYLDSPIAKLKIEIGWCYLVKIHWSTYQHFSNT